MEIEWNPMENDSGHIAADKGLDELDQNDIFCTGKVRMQMAKEKARLSGRPLRKHRNGKIDLGAVLDDPAAREFVCPYCSFTFACKHVMERHVRQIHEKHLLYTYQCPKCSYSTVRKDQMRSHFSVVHEDFKPFNCSECSFRAPKSFRVTAHIQKAHNGVGAVIHDTNLKPRAVSPPPPEVMQKARLDYHEKSTLEKASPNPVTISIDAIPSTRDQQIKLQFPTSAPKTNKIRIVSVAKPVATKTVEKPPKIVDLPGLYCPHCPFKADTQLAMGDHVVTEHRAEHIARNVGEALRKVCSLCEASFPSPDKLEQHVKDAHPDVIVVVKPSTSS